MSCTFAEIAQLERLEVAQQDVAGTLVWLQCVEVLSGLVMGATEIAPGAFLLNHQHARPEQIHITRAAVELLNMLLVSRDGSPLDTEDREEVVVEALRFALFVGCALPLLGEAGCTAANLVPRKTHQTA